MTTQSRVRPRRALVVLGVIVAAAVVIAIALFGGSAAVESAPKAAARGLPPTPTPVATKIPRPVVPPGTVVATGDIVSADGATGGSVQIVAIAGRSTSAFQLVIPDFWTSLGGDSEVVATPSRVADDITCLGTGLAYPVGSLASIRRTAVSISNASTGGDPSFVDSLALVRPTDDPDCVARVVALAQLQWSMPDLRPDIVVADSGADDGANGAVAIGADGQPEAYTVAEGDDMASIAVRFGIGVDDLLYLNPARQPDPRDRTAHAGETLNLAKRLR
ncbi:LysM peptidoglycan-binding domain-containing protein [Microbacteriaceae bacterium VKM Ac-2854]|nr:LysM peptidoglycan-binding domain-containing protein [Microbacteriaceae bacterium VKM Ac-2854]